MTTGHLVLTSIVFVIPSAAIERKENTTNTEDRQNKPTDFYRDY